MTWSESNSTLSLRRTVTQIAHSVTSWIFQRIVYQENSITKYNFIRAECERKWVSDCSLLSPRSVISKVWYPQGPISLMATTPENCLAGYHHNILANLEETHVLQAPVSSKAQFWVKFRTVQCIIAGHSLLQTFCGKHWFCSVQWQCADCHKIVIIT